MKAFSGQNTVSSRLPDGRQNPAYVAEYKKRRGKAAIQAYVRSYWKRPVNIEKRKERVRQWYTANADHCRARAREHYRKNRERYSLVGKAKRKQVRLLVFEKYGGAFCACCGSADMEFLTIDHIHGGGNKHRKSLGLPSIYAWLVKEGFPEGYRVLCYNCNCARGHYGFCPHEFGSAYKEIEDGPQSTHSGQPVQ